MAVIRDPMFWLTVVVSVVLSVVVTVAFHWWRSGSVGRY